MELYTELAKTLTGDGIHCRFQAARQLTISRQEGPIWPDRGNSFWVTHAAGSWHLFTWLNVGYRVPHDSDIVELCRTCMAHGSAAMHSVPADIAEQFGLVRLSEHEEELVLQTLDFTA